MVLDTENIRVLVKRIRFAAEMTKMFIRVHPESVTLYKDEKPNSDSIILHSSYTDYSLLLYDTQIYPSEYMPNDYIENDMSIGYDPESTTFIINELQEDVPILDISELTEENLFQLSLIHDTHVLQGMYIMAVCKEMNMPGFNITLRTLEVLEGLLDGYFIDPKTNKKQYTPEGSILRIESHPFGYKSTW